MKNCARQSHNNRGLSGSMPFKKHPSPEMKNFGTGVASQKIIEQNSSHLFLEKDVINLLMRIVSEHIFIIAFGGSISLDSTCLVQRVGMLQQEVFIAFRKTIFLSIFSIFVNQLITQVKSSRII